MDNADKYAHYQNEVMDVDNIEGTEVKINPDFYIHMALLKAQFALVKDNMKEGLIQFRLVVEHIEVLCRAAKMLTDDYSIQIEEFKKSPEYMEQENDFFKSAKLAHKKLELLMMEVFSNKLSTMPLKDR